MRLFPEIQTFAQTGLFPADAYGLSWVLLTAVGAPVVEMKPIPCGLFQRLDARLNPSPAWSEASARPEWAWLELRAHSRLAPIVQRVACVHRSEVGGLKYGRAVVGDHEANVSIIIELPAFDLELVRDGHLTMRPRDRVTGHYGEPAILNPEHLLARRI